MQRKKFGTDVDRCAVLIRISAIEERLADGTLFTREPERAKALAATLEDLRTQAEAAEARWLELAEAAEG